MLKKQLSKGNNGLVKHKYITFIVEADNKAAAKSRLSRIETDMLCSFVNDVRPQKEKSSKMRGSV